MSWSDSIKAFLAGQLENYTAVAVIGRKEGLWGNSTDFELSPAEVKDITSLCTSENEIAMTGVHIKEEKYIKVQVLEPDIYKIIHPTIVLKKGADSALIVSAEDVIVVAIVKKFNKSNEPIRPQDVFEPVDGYASYLDNYYQTPRAA